LSIYNWKKTKKRVFYLKNKGKTGRLEEDLTQRRGGRMKKKKGVFVC
jgi:hypothetical protein